MEGMEKMDNVKIVSEKLETYNQTASEHGAAIKNSLSKIGELLKEMSQIPGSEADVAELLKMKTSLEDQQARLN